MCCEAPLRLCVKILSSLQNVDFKFLRAAILRILHILGNFN